MPTPVSSARQYLTEEAARALDDAVAVARRRNHSQTTSLHIVSALLTLPSSTLRDACRRARSSYSQRLQFQALELSVGVSLDRLPTSKNVEEEPPVSNSLMAAIKRSQANQRRHPESFHLLQMYNQQQQTTSFLKVELKQFILSILDDPIVSRVFGEAGFRSCDIKIALLQPPMPQASQFSRSRYTPIFLSNLTGSEMARPGFNFPFMGNPGIEDGDENCRRIGEVLTRKTNRNPLLMGVSAKGALRSFIESVQRGRGAVFSADLAGLNIICIDKEISEFFVECGTEENMGSKFKDLSLMAEQCPGPGIAVNFGELEAFIGDAVPSAAVRFVVSQLTSLLQIHGGKLWLVGVAGTSDTYSKFLDLFPTVEKDWDLYPLPLTSVTYSMQGLYSKSSLMGSFVPFGGFFSTPHEFENPVSSKNQSFNFCHVCKEKYEKEVADVGKIGPTASPSDCSASLPWLQKKKVNVDVDEGLDLAKTSEDMTSNAKVLGLQKKWSDICQSHHHTQALSEVDISQTRFPSTMGLIFGSGFRESSSKDPPSQSSQSIFPSKQILPVPVLSSAVSVNTGSDKVVKVSKSQQTDMQSPWIASPSMANMHLLDCRSSSRLTSVTTDLGLGTLYTSPAREPNMTLLDCKSPASLTSVTTDLGLGTIYRLAEPNTPKLRDHKEHHNHLSDSLSADFDATNESSSQPKAQSFCSGPRLEGKFDSLDFKSLNLRLTEKVGWQDEAIYAISRTLSLYRSGIGKHHGSHVRGDIWLAFLGPDSVGKKKIASALAEVISGNTESLISVDLGSQDRVHPSNSIFESQKSYCFNVLRRKTVVDYIAGELSKKPQSVVFLENVEKADYLVQTSLFQGIRLGKFPDSHGREISINNTIFLVTSTLYNGTSTFLSEEYTMFSEETILEAKRCPMKLVLGHISEDVKRSGGTNVKIAPKRTFNPTASNKRNLPQGCNSIKQTTASKIPRRDPETSRSNLDLNMPLEEVEEEINDNACKSESSVENWLKDFYSQIDEVAFKPFNFDVLAEKFLKSISMQFQRRFRSEVLLEIDYEVMVQILAAAWLSDKKNAVEDWIEHVLGRCFNEAQHKYHPGAQCAMKLVTCEGNFVEEQVAGICLPATINLN